MRHPACANERCHHDNYEGRFGLCHVCWPMLRAGILATLIVCVCVWMVGTEIARAWPDLRRWDLTASTQQEQAR